MSVHKIAVVDYGLGNVKSLMSALNEVGAVAELCHSPESLSGYRSAIIPGVGAFANAMDRLRSGGWAEALMAHARSGKYLLGICLGMQVLLENSEEFGSTAGLGLIEGEVKKLLTASDKGKLPNIGWRSISVDSRDTGLFQSIPENNRFYFVHSYAAVPKQDASVLCRSDYLNIDFCAGVVRENVVGVQFHPEKSAVDGLTFLKNFSDMSGE